MVAFGYDVTDEFALNGRFGGLEVVMDERVSIEVPRRGTT